MVWSGLKLSLDSPVPAPYLHLHLCPSAGLIHWSSDCTAMMHCPVITPLVYMSISCHEHQTLSALVMGFLCHITALLVSTCILAGYNLQPCWLQFTALLITINLFWTNFGRTSLLLGSILQHLCLQTCCCTGAD